MIFKKNKSKATDDINAFYNKAIQAVKQLKKDSLQAMNEAYENQK